MKGRVVVGMSGGVDSSVAAFLLKEQGYEVLGMFMRNWHDETVTLNNECPWIDDANDALLVADQLGIPFQLIDLSEQYKTKIVDYMFAEYQAGRTPNPDVLCNKEIKFDVFLDAAMKLGAEFVATGHYCRKIEHKNGIFGLGAGKDLNKDQSYFLCQISPNQLAKALFPIGDLQKSEVRKIAEEQGLLTAKKKDSQGLCFVGKISLPTFLQQQLKPKKGKIIEIDSNHPSISNYHNSLISLDKDSLENYIKPFDLKENDGICVGEHQGAHYYTVGQRKGLHIGGRPEPSFVIQIDIENNIIYTGQTDQHLGLNKKVLFLNNKDINWLRPDLKLAIGQEANYKVRIRYRQVLQEALLIQKEDGIYIVFDKFQKGITPGQFAAWYLEDELIGSGVIQ